MSLKTLVASIAFVFVSAAPAGANAAAADWPSYNRTLTGDRYSPLDAINTRNVRNLKIRCTYDTGEQVSFQTGLVEVGGALLFGTEKDTFSIDANTCKQNWRAHEEFASGALKVDRGLVWADGNVYRGTADGRVLAYAAKDGHRLWATTIADPAKGESVPAAPIAWNGMIFAGNAGSDNKGVKGRMYALDAKDGHIVWEFYMVPKGAGDFARGPQAPSDGSPATGSWNNGKDFPITGGGTWTSYTLDPAEGLLYVPGGNPAPDFSNEDRPGDNLFTDSVVVLDAKTGAYRRHFQLTKRDFHDWDASTAPVVFTSKANRKLLAEAAKDGHLHVIDLGSGKTLFSEPVTRILNIDAPMTAAGTRFCPGVMGGEEWNSPAYAPASNLLFTGEVDWCTTVNLVPRDKIASAPDGKPWSGDSTGFGKQDDKKDWAGYMTATDADTGKRVWQFKAPAPLMGGITPTAGGVLFFGDMVGTFYAFDSASGKKISSWDLGGAIAGGVITYDSGEGQRVATTAGMTSTIWQTGEVTGKVIVLGL